MMKRRMTRGLILLGSAVAVVATPLWMAAQQQNAPSTGPASAAPGNAAPGNTTPGAATPGAATPGAAAPTAPPVIPPIPGMPGVGEVSQPTTGPLSKPPATQMTVRFKDAPIDAVLQELSAKAGYAVIKTVPLDGRVTVWNDTPIPPSKVIELLNSLLKDRGYTAILQGRVLKVGLITDLVHQNTPVHISADPATVEETDEIITQVIPVRSVDAVKLKADLQALVSSTAVLSANGGSNSIIITDTSANIRRIVAIIANLDNHDALSNDIVVQHLTYADATATAKLITDIFAPPTQTTGQQQNGRTGGGGFANFFGGGGPGGGGGGRGGGGGNPFGGGGPGGAPGAAGAAAGSEEGKTGTVIASADTRTNTIVVTGPKDTLDLIKAKILSIIDKDPVTDQVIFTYRVKNGQAVDMAATLNNVFSGNTQSTSSNRGTNYSSSTGNRASTGFGSGVGSSGGGGAFGGSLGSTSGRSGSSGSSGSNSTANRTGSSGSSGFGGISGSSGAGSVAGPASDLIGQVEVVADSDTNSLLVVTATRLRAQVQEMIDQLDRPVPQVLIKVLIAEVTHDRSDDLGLDFSILNLSKGLTAGSNAGNVSAAQALAASGAGSGLAVNLVESQLTTTFHALAVAGKLDVLSRPYILTSDNQEATILVGQEVPFVTNTRVDTLGGTTSTIQYQDIGILLDVTPHVNQDGLVVMDVAPQISSQSEQSLQLQTGVSSPVFNQRSASSHVGVRDGDTIVIGGLMQDQKTMTVTKVPLLGDIPYLGLLFQRDQVSKTKTELLIFLTPHVALAPAHLPAMSEDEVKGLRLTPGAVQPGTFQDHIKGMQRGGSATQPALPIPKPEKDRDAWEPEPKMP
jgi:general secretion pathway protein D